jgi:hypothetical protein
MSSHGKVLDLFNDGYLELQDVVGNVEPLPSLVPYEEYEQNVIVYRMDTNHEIFMALIQDFTDRKAYDTGKELWTWYVQWEVDETAPSPPIALPHSPKKPRLALGQPTTPKDAHNGPMLKAERRIIATALMREEDMLRILLDIVQVDSTIVPNFVEFMYRWIDFYEGDGRALKAALKGEIPSLWDFEYHPLVLPVDVKEAAEKAKAEAAASGAARDGASDEAGDKTRRTEDLAQGSPTKRMRQKPDLAAMEAQAEESERLQYREVHYGIRPPKLKEPLPPLINIPLDRKKREHYYVACWKSRHRAFNLLRDAGVTVAQMRNYKKGQEAHPRDTPQHAGGDGLKYYEEDARLAQPILVEREKQKQLRNKQMEITISNKLAIEAQLAASSATPEGLSGIPLIPLTPLYPKRPSMSSDLLRRTQATRASSAEERVNIVPSPLVGKMKSKLFEGAKDKQALHGMFGRGSTQPVPRPTAGMCDGDDVDSESEFDDEGDDEDDQMRTTSTASGSNTGAALPPIPSLPRPSLPTPSQPTASPMQPSHPNMPHVGSFVPQQPTPGHATAGPTQSGPGTPDVLEYMRNLTPIQARNLVMTLIPNTGQAIADSIRAPAAGPSSQAPAQTTQVANGASNSAMHMPTNPQMGFGQAPRPALPSLPPPPRAPALTFSPPQLPPGQAQPPRAIQGDANFLRLGEPPRLQVPPLPSPVPGQGFPQGGMHMFGGTNGTGAYPSGTGFGFAQQAPPQQFQPSAQQQPNAHRPNMPQQSAYPVAPGLSAPPPPPAFAQRLLVAQASGHQGLQPSPASTSFAAQSTYTTPPPIPRSPNPFLTPAPSMQRNAPTPLNLAPAFPSLAPSLMATSPFTSRPEKGIPIQIYYPNILLPYNLIGPSGLKLGNLPLNLPGRRVRQNAPVAETDAFLLGHTIPGSGEITLSRAIFLPAGVWKNALERVRKEKYEVLETYLGPRGGSMFLDHPGPHRAAYEKITQAFSLIAPEAGNREEEVTKRWRVTQGLMTATDRGSVWEGWGVVIDRGIGMSKEERAGAFILRYLVDGADEEVERRRRMVEEMIEEDEREGEGELEEGEIEDGDVEDVDMEA